jgi:hypothetical protein
MHWASIISLVIECFPWWISKISWIFCRTSTKENYCILWIHIILGWQKMGKILTNQVFQKSKHVNNKICYVCNHVKLKICLFVMGFSNDFFTFDPSWCQFTNNNNFLLQCLLFKPNIWLEQVCCKKWTKIVPDQLLVWGIRALWSFWMVLNWS